MSLRAIFQAATIARMTTPIPLTTPTTLTTLTTRTTATMVTIKIALVLPTILLDRTIINLASSSLSLFVSVFLVRWANTCSV